MFTLWTGAVATTEKPHETRSSDARQTPEYSLGNCVTESAAVHLTSSMSLLVPCNETIGCLFSIVSASYRVFCYKTAIPSFKQVTSTTSTFTVHYKVHYSLYYVQARFRNHCESNVKHARLDLGKLEHLYVSEQWLFVCPNKSSILPTELCNTGLFIKSSRMWRVNVKMMMKFLVKWKALIKWLAAS